MEIIKEVGDRISTERIEQVYENQLRSFITPKIQVNGRMVAIKDSNTISGIVECKNKNEATKIAKATIKELKNKAN